MDETNNLVDMAKGMSDIDTSKMSSFSVALNDLAGIGVNNFIRAFTDSASKISDCAKDTLNTFISAAKTMQSDFSETGKQLTNYLINGINSKYGDIKSAFMKGVNDGVSKINKKKGDFYNAGVCLSVNIVNGVKGKYDDVKNAFIKGVTVALDSLNDKYDGFYEAGCNLATGFSKGIEDYTSSVVIQTRIMAEQAVQTAKEVLGIASPSKVFAEMGRYADEGFAVGLNNYAGEVYKASENVGFSAINSMSKAISEISDSIEHDLDNEPKIRPVLDLSEIQNGASRLSEMMNSESFDISGSLRLAQHTSRSIRESRAVYDNQSQAENEKLGALMTALNKLSDNPSQSFSNTFNISGNNPKEIANEVSKIIQRQTERRSAVWDR